MRTTANTTNKFRATPDDTAHRSIAEELVAFKRKGHPIHSPKLILVGQVNFRKS